MRALLLEDELPAANRLRRLLAEADADLRVLDVLDSVEGAVAWLRAHPAPDLLFCDIHLADGLSFEIFANAPVDCPVIFTTAYDAYALQAFRHNSVDYLLKPIEAEALARALDKYRRVFAGGGTAPLPDAAQMRAILDGWGKPAWRRRFLVKRGDRLDYVPSEAVAFAYSAEGLTHLVARDGHRDLVDRSLEELAAELDPERFFRVSRKCLVALPAISAIHKYFSGRLKLELSPAAPFEVLVSRERVDAFQAWLDR